jgi:predicted dehydrogenase
MGEAVPPSDRITLGLIGIGMMGRGHLRNCLRYPETQVLAVCDVDRWRREDAKTTAERVYAERTGGTYRGPQMYNDLRGLLARDDVDAVVIATGDNWHGPATVMAAKAGKDIYCEKPISKTIREARAMVEAVRRYGRVAQIGLQQRSTPEFIKASHLVRSGRIGAVKIVYVAFSGTNTDVNLPGEPVPEGLDWQQWLGPAPWHPFNGRFHHYGRPPRVVPWDFCRDFGGGNLTSNAVHAVDVVQWGLGMDESGPVKIIPPETGQYPSLLRAQGLGREDADPELRRFVCGR